MELWIRTQNKEGLFKINSGLVIEHGLYMQELGYKIKMYNKESSHVVVLGLYKTEERANEILNEIQSILIDYKRMSRVVYEMPDK